MARTPNQSAPPVRPRHELLQVVSVVMLLTVISVLLYIRAKSDQSFNNLQKSLRAVKYRQLMLTDNPPPDVALGLAQEILPPAAQRPLDAIYSGD